MVVWRQREGAVEGEGSEIKSRAGGQGGQQGSREKKGVLWAMTLDCPAICLCKQI